jgi:hypothetical protein
MAGLTSRSVGSHPVPVTRLALAPYNYGGRECTSIHNSHVNADSLSILYSLCPDLLPTRRVLVRITPRLHGVECVMRNGYYCIAVR